MLPDEEFSYGVGNRPSTPMKLVMGNCYAIDAETKNQDTYMNETGKRATTLGKKVTAKKTKSQALREEVAQKEKDYKGKPNYEDSFKISKFTSSNMTKVDTRLNKNK